MNRDELDAFLASADDVLDNWPGSVDAMTTAATDADDPGSEPAELAGLRVVDSYYDQLTFSGDNDDADDATTDDDTEPYLGPSFIYYGWGGAEITGPVRAPAWLAALPLDRLIRVVFYGVNDVIAAAVTRAASPTYVVTARTTAADIAAWQRAIATRRAAAEARLTAQEVRLRAQLTAAVDRASHVFSAHAQATAAALAELDRLVRPALATTQRPELTRGRDALLARRQLRQPAPTSQATATSRRALTAHPARRRATTASFQRRRV